MNSSVLSYRHFYLIGIKGVAMASLAQCLLDAGKKVSGSDVAEDFVTAELLKKLPLRIDTDFSQPIPSDVDCVVYTSAHQAQNNPQVKSALTQNLPVYSQAQAVAELFNQKQGVAVCGVGGKSTTSAMITWILVKAGLQPSFSVGVGNIIGLNLTGQWQRDTQYFVAEADEYVTDPAAPSRGEPITPRFSFLLPQITVCTNLKFDHPDVYKDFSHTKTVFNSFFNQIKSGGHLIINQNDVPEISAPAHVTVHTVGNQHGSEYYLDLTSLTTTKGQTAAQLQVGERKIELALSLPGGYNLMNAVQAVAACSIMGVSLQDSVAFLAQFRSTKRRAEFIGTKQGVEYYDDYAHHPHEIAQVLTAFRQWYPEKKLVVAFQSHTFSRTKALFSDMAQAFSVADEVAMIDIFASAREPFDPSITSQMLCEAITQNFPKIKAHNFKTLPNLAEYLQKQLQPGDVCLTLGAGNIYHLHDLVK